MPFESKSQARLFFVKERRGELPKGTALRWAHHTKDMKKLPERVGGGDDEKRAFAAAFILKCAAAGITSPADVIAEARRQVSLLKSAAAREKRAEGTLSTLGEWAGRASVLPVLGTIGLPLALGASGGYLAGNARNQADEADAQTLQLRAAANAYRRQAALAQAHARVRKIVASDPKKYVQIA